MEKSRDEFLLRRLLESNLFFFFLMNFAKFDDSGSRLHRAMDYSALDGRILSPIVIEFANVGRKRSAQSCVGRRFPDQYGRSPQSRAAEQPSQDSIGFVVSGFSRLSSVASLSCLSQRLINVFLRGRVLSFGFVRKALKICLYIFRLLSSLS